MRECLLLGIDGRDDVTDTALVKAFEPIVTLKILQMTAHGAVGFNLLIGLARESAGRAQSL